MVLDIEPIQIVAYLAVAVGVKILIGYVMRPGETGVGPGAGRTKRLVGRVTGLTVFPLKSSRGIDTDRAECLPVGLRLIPNDSSIQGKKNGDVRDR